MSTARSSMLYAFANKYISVAIQIVSITLVARLLTPEEIGIYSIAAALFGFVFLLRDFGVSNYLIQEKELTRDRIASALTVSVFLCWSLALLVFLSTEMLAAFYQREELERIFRLLCVNLMLIPFGAVTLSLLKREMHFDKVMVIDTISAGVGAGTTITSAIMGMSYLSPALGSLAGTLTTVLLSLLYRPKGLPKFLGFSEVRRVTSYGWKIGGINISNHIKATSSDLVLGKLQSPTEVAYFNRAGSIYRLFDMLVVGALSPLFQSVMAKKNREGNPLKALYLRTSACYMMLAWSFSAVVVVHAETLILILFGDQWVGVSNVFRLLVFSFLLDSITKFYLLTTMVVGFPGKAFKLSVLLAIAQILVMVIFGSGELELLALAVIIPSIIRIVYVLYDLRSSFEIGVLEIISISKVPAISLSILLAVNIAIAAFYDLGGVSVLSFLIGGACSLVVWWFIVNRVNHPVKSELEGVVSPIFAKVLGKR